MPLGIGSALWACVLPVEKKNLLENPSFEFDRGGGNAALSGGVTDLGTTTQYQQFGARSMYVVPNANGTSGVYAGTWASGNGTDYTVSAYVRGQVGIPYVLAASDFLAATFIGSVTFTGGGTWQRYSVSYTETGDTVRRLVIRKNASANEGTYWIDGAQVEVGSLTTFISGDDGGGTWQGAPHASQSYRSGQTRAGGSVIALADLGFQPDQYPGVGMPPIEVSSQSYAVIDGAQFQRQRAAARGFNLTFAPLHGTTLAGLHAVRQAFIDTIKPDAVTPQQPVRFLYVGGQGTVQIDAYYQSGLELGNLDGPIAEVAAISFLATDPYWYAPTQEGTALRPRISLGSSNHIMKRSPLGAWGTLGSNGTTVQYNAAGAQIQSLAINPAGTLFLGGVFGSIGGTVFPSVGMYYPSSNTFGTLVGGGTVDENGLFYNCLQLNSTGTLFLAGNFVRAGGTANLRGLAQWTGAGFGTLSGGTTNAGCGPIFFSPTGTLFVAGAFSAANGTAGANFIAMWNGAWGTLGFGGLTSGGPASMAWGPNKKLYLGGAFTALGGTVGTAVGFWNGTFGTFQTGGCDNVVHSVAVGKDGVVFEGGNFTVLGGQSFLSIAKFNGVAQQALANGLNKAGTTADVWSMMYDPISPSTLIVGGGNFISANGILLGNNGIFATNCVAQWNGNVFLPLDIVLPANGTVFAMATAPDKTIYLAGQFSGTAIAATTGTIINSGRAVAYPTLRLRNTGASGTARIFSMRNTTTNAGLYFDLSLLPGETAALNLTPGRRSFTSDYQGDVFRAILPGSNLTSWNLLSGPNVVAFLADSDNLEASLFWQPRSASIDGGTVY